MQSYPMIIDGREVTTDRTYPVRLPWDGTTMAEVHEGNVASLDCAIRASLEAAPMMASMENGERAGLLQKVADLLRRDAEEFASLLVAETGKPLREARLETERAQQTLVWASIAARELRGETVPIDGRLAITIRQPLGVIGAITPFNFPLNLSMHKIAPALAGGNSVVHKPSEVTPLSAIRLAKTFLEAGAPRGAYNIVTGDGEAIGRAMVADPRIAMITFTGSVAVGKEIRAQAGLKRVTLELGGNCPVIIEPDADLTLAVERCVAGSFAHSGQVCISVQRIFVHEKIADEFLHRLKAGADRLVIGHPMQESTEISSLISEEEAMRVESWIEEAISVGATRITGGQRSRATIRPCILAEVPPEAKMSCQEAFGPVVAVNRYSDLADAIRRANDSPYGLQSGLFTRDLTRAFETARKLQAGGILINDVPSF
ncbi:MAG: aldehyde dehydrogenase family protein, partial [Bryobacteraceae bacterium]|nr:aldehyde dehydrogenase family protein [Bryobacteraceae bacterium]